MRRSEQIIITSLGRAGTSPQNPNPPALVWISASSDATPDFDIDLPNGNGNYKDAAAGDHLIIEYQLQSGGAWTTYIDRTLSAGDITDDIISVTGVSSLANGDYYFRGRITRGALVSSNSANVSVTISVTSAWLLEDSSGHWQLEDASGNWILEEA